MKILILANCSGGLYRFRGKLISKLLENHEVYASVPNSGSLDELQQLGCKVVQTNIDRRGINPVTDIRLAAAYYRLIRRLAPDLVVTYTIKPNVYGGMVCRLLRVPYGANITGLGTAFQKKGALRMLVTHMHRMALKKAKAVFFENSGNLTFMVSEKIVDPRRCCLLSGAGVDLQHFSVKEYPADETPVRFLFVGRVMKEKGVEELFAAMEQLRKDGLDCTLDVLGGFEEDYEAAIQAGQAANWLRYHGYVKDVRPFIENSHCFVLPSWHEGMANTNLECAAMGRPIITSDIPGCKEAVIENISGLLCEPKNTQSLYAAMKAFCALPNAQRAAMGQAGRAHMEEVFDKKKVVAQTMKGLGL